MIGFATRIAVAGRIDIDCKVGAVGVQHVAGNAYRAVTKLFQNYIDVPHNAFDGDPID